MVPEEAHVLQLSFCAAPSLKVWEYVSWDGKGERQQCCSSSVQVHLLGRLCSFTAFLKCHFVTVKCSLKILKYFQLSSTSQIELHISLVSKSDEFVFINSGPSGADMLQSVNQTCIKLQGSAQPPDPGFGGLGVEGGRRGWWAWIALFLKINSALNVALL